MAKLEYTLIDSFQKFNFLGKRLFDFINVKINISTGNYVGDGVTEKNIRIDIIPRCIIVFPSNDELPVIWIDGFVKPISKQFDGMTITDGILGPTIKRDFFVVSMGINIPGDNYNWIVFGE